MLAAWHDDEVYYCSNKNLSIVLSLWAYVDILTMRTDKIKQEFFQAVAMLVLLYGWNAWRKSKKETTQGFGWSFWIIRKQI